MRRPDCCCQQNSLQQNLLQQKPLQHNRCVCVAWGAACLAVPGG